MNKFRLFVTITVLVMGTHKVLACGCRTFNFWMCDLSKDCGCDPVFFGDCSDEVNYIPGSTAYDCDYLGSPNNMYCYPLESVLCFRTQECAAASFHPGEICAGVSGACTWFQFYICIDCGPVGLSVPWYKTHYKCISI